MKAVRLAENTRNAAAYLLADHIDAMLAAGEDLLRDERVLVGPAANHTQNGHPGACRRDPPDRGRHAGGELDPGNKCRDDVFLIRLWAIEFSRAIVPKYNFCFGPSDQAPPC